MNKAFIFTAILSVSFGLIACSGEADKRSSAVASMTAECGSRMKDQDLYFSLNKKYHGNCECLISEWTKDMDQRDLTLARAGLHHFFELSKIGGNYKAVNLNSHKEFEKDMEEWLQNWKDTHLKEGLNRVEAEHVMSDFSRAQRRCNKKT